MPTSVRPWRRRFQQWFQSRLPVSDQLVLTQRNVYILPTGPGILLAFTLLVLLVTSINYQLNLGYLLTFLLTGSAVVGMHVCHATLRGLRLHLSAPPAHFAGTPVHLGIHLTSTRRTVRHGIGLAIFGSGQWSWTDVPAQGECKVEVAFSAARRGLWRVPALTAETRYPLGTFRVWTVWRPAARVLVYPAPEAQAPPLPAGSPHSGGTTSAQPQHGTEFDGVRAYRRGDPLKLVVWKKAAQSDALVSRDAQQMQHLELWLDLAHTGLSGAAAAVLEMQLSRLCAWVLLADKRGLQYGLRLGGVVLAPGNGAAHKASCLQALALY
ncbi:MAG: DUF58 domain-containing protein [Rhodoferax sp.]